MSLNSDSELNETECVRLIKKGDRNAFKSLFIKYYDRLCRFVYNYVKSETVAESLVQEIFVQLWEERAQLDPQKNIRAYLYKLVRNEALDYLEHENIVREKLSLIKSVGEASLTNEVPAIDKDKFWLFVQDQIDKLPPKTRLIYKMSRKDGLTYNEIAEVLSVSPKTVEYHMSKALETLRQELESKLPSFFS